MISPEARNQPFGLPRADRSTLSTGFVDFASPYYPAHAMATNSTLIIPILAIAYLILVYGALWWWSKRSTRSTRT
ncbi:MAG TPA: hypothetical protein IGR64_10680 [Leptolyngbyaceae cyanobacterium M65_K2018_010]|nr:hypothetical protein [Leptolyngbyaceae cyanobacterium M65_K2018_010]